MAIPVATGGIWWAKPTQRMHQAPKFKYENYKLVKFCQFALYNLGNQKLTLTATWGDFHPNSQSTITSGDFHLGTTWPPLLSWWKSPGVSIPGVWVIFAENLEVVNADKCSPPLVVGTWTHGRNFVVKWGGTAWCETNIVIGSMQKWRFIYTDSQSYLLRCFASNTDHALLCACRWFTY